MFRVAERRKPLQLNNEQANNGVDLTLNNVFIRAVVVIYYICQALMLYSRSTFEPYLGLVLATLAAVLMFTPFYYIPVAVVMFTPHAMGTIIMGRISQFVFMGFLLVFRMFVVRFRISFALNDLFWLFLGIVNCANTALFLRDSVGPEKFTIIVIFTLWMVYIRCDSHQNPDVFDRFLLAFAVGIASNATVNLITRSATLYESSDRMGLIGFSSSDPNLAAMVLTFGIAVFISSGLVKTGVKIVACVLLIVSLITTVSISGFIAVILVVMLFAIVMNKNKNNVSILLVLLLGALLAIYLFPALGIMGERNDGGEAINYLEYFQDKLNEKAGSFLGNDIDNATSGRSDLMRINMEYLFEQPALKQLFGGNSVNPLGINVSHNTFVDIMLRYGYLGFVAVFIIMCYSLIKCIQRTRITGNCTVLICKILFIYWSLTLSLFDSNAVLWFALVLMF